MLSGLDCRIYLACKIVVKAIFAVKNYVKLGRVCHLDSILNASI